MLSGGQSLAQVPPYLAKPLAATLESPLFPKWENATEESEGETNTFAEKALVPEVVQRIIADGRKYLGKPYRYRGAAKWPLDCSGFLYFIYGNQGVALSRTSAAMHAVCQRVTEPRVGDLIFFKGTPSHRPNGVGHVAMVVEIKDGVVYMMHSSSRGIVWENFTGRKNYERRFVSYGRVNALNTHWDRIAREQTNATPSVPIG